MKIEHIRAEAVGEMCGCGDDEFALDVLNCSCLELRGLVDLENLRDI